MAQGAGDPRLREIVTIAADENSGRDFARQNMLMLDDAADNTASRRPPFFSARNTGLPWRCSSYEGT